MSDIIISILIIAFVIYLLEETGIGLIAIVVFIFALGPQLIENTDNACQAVNVINYRHQNESNSPIPSDTWQKLMSDGKIIENQTGEVRCMDNYWRITISKTTTHN